MKRSVLLFMVCPALFAASLTVAHVDKEQTGWNQAESILTPANVSGGRFIKLGSWSIDNFSFAQPLIVPALTIGSVTTDVLFVATMTNGVFAYDALRPGTPALWYTNVGPIWNGQGGTLPYFTPGGLSGCPGTPAIDLPNHNLYVLCSVGSAPDWTLFKLDLTTGAVISSVVVSGSVVGTGDTAGTIADSTTGPNLNFFPVHSESKPGLMIANGNVYLMFGSQGDSHPYHGWLFAYSTTSLTQVGVWCSTPNGYGGALWSGPPAVDSSGNLYVTTGNGDGGGTNGNLADAVVKLSPTLSLLDWFTPATYATLAAVDADVASNRAVLIPGQNKVIVASKDWTVYVVNTNCMGHIQGSGFGGCTQQIFPTNASGVAGAGTGSYGAVWMDNKLILPTTNGVYYGFSYSEGTFNTTPYATVASGSYASPNGQLSGSSSGTSNEILWTVTNTASAFSTPRPGVLRAWNPATLAEYWNSSMSPADDLGHATKFASPAVVNGRVYVTTSGDTVVVYGLTADTGTFSAGAVATGGAAQQ